MRANLICRLMLLPMVMAPTLANACPIVDAAARFAEGQISDCGQKLKGAALNSCVGEALSGLSSGVGASPLRDVSSQAPGPIATAASQLRAADKGGAISALNRARSVISGLAAQSSQASRDAYNRINQVFSRAISTINSKG